MLLVDSGTLSYSNPLFSLTLSALTPTASAASANTARATALTAGLLHLLQDHLCVTEPPYH